MPHIICFADQTSLYGLPFYDTEIRVIKQGVEVYPHPDVSLYCSYSDVSASEITY